MSRPSLVLVNDFIQRLKSLEKIRAKMESLANRDLVARRDVEKVYEAVYLRSITHFESFIEELFLGMLTKRITPSSRDVVLRVEFKSDQVARELVFSGRSYVDWFPYNKTEKLAELFFRGGRPFTNLEKQDKADIEQFMAIRNVIAHESTHAMSVFNEKVLEPLLPLAPREKTPAGHLRSFITPPQTRFELYSIKMVGLARKIGC